MPDVQHRVRLLAVDLTLLVALVIALALFFDFTNGFHDTANAMATPIAMRPNTNEAHAARF